MKLPRFKLESFFEKYEFSVPYLLCASDNETLTMNELLEMADHECLDLWENLNVGYTEVSGHPLLKQEIAKLYSVPCTVGTFAGAGEAIVAAMLAIVRPGDHVIAPFPCYQSLSEMPKALGADVSLCPFRETENGWHFAIEDLEKLVRPNTRLIVINFPHNPTSAHIDKKTLEQIIALAKKSNAYLLSDEVYRFSEHDGKSLPPAIDLYEKALSIGVMSKTFGLAGTRVGWIATRDQELLKRCLDMKCYMSLCNSAPSEILTLIALRNKNKIIQRNLQIIRSNLVLLDEFFAKYLHVFKWNRPKAGSTGFPKLLVGSIDDLAIDLIDKKGVLLLPGSVYDFPGNHFRLGFGRSNMPEVLAKLAEYVEERYS